MRPDQGAIPSASVTFKIAPPNARYRYMFLGNPGWAFQTSYVGHDGICNFLVACSLGMPPGLPRPPCVRVAYSIILLALCPAWPQPNSGIIYKDMTACPCVIESGLRTRKSL